MWNLCQKKRGRKPKPVNPEDWLNRTEMVFGVICNAEKNFILKLYVEAGLSPDEIAEKLHRLPKGIKRAINSASKSGELEKLKAEFHEKTGFVPIEDKADTSIGDTTNSLIEDKADVSTEIPVDDKKDISIGDKTDTMENISRMKETSQNRLLSDVLSSRFGSSSYIMPAQTEVINGVKYDIGGVMALYKAGWSASKIAKEKNYDEVMVKMILHKHVKGSHT